MDGLARRTSRRRGVRPCVRHAGKRSVDAKRRKIIWADGERLSIEQSAERIHAEHPDRPRELIEISLCSWFEHRVPESGSERQINELDRLFGPWIRDRERKSRAGKE